MPFLMSTTPSANSDVNTTPMLASLGTPAYWCSVCVRNVDSRPADDGADQQRADAVRARQDERDGQPRQHGVRQGVAHQAHPPQHEKAADERAGARWSRRR